MTRKAHGSLSWLAVTAVALFACSGNDPVQPSDPDGLGSQGHSGSAGSAGTVAGNITGGGAGIAGSGTSAEAGAAGKGGGAGGSTVVSNGADTSAGTVAGNITGGGAGIAGSGTGAEAGAAGRGSGAGGSTVVSNGADTSAQNGARLTVDPESVDLGTIDPETSKNVSLVVTNAGSALSGEIRWTLDPSISYVQGNGVRLEPQATRKLEFKVAPATTGAFSSSISISSDPGATPPLRIPVVGTVAPTGPFTVSPRRFDLGEKYPGNSSTKTITVTALTTLTDLTITGSDWITVGGTCTANLAEGESCRVDATFTMKHPGTASDSVEIRAGGVSKSVAFKAHTPTNY